MAGKPVWTSDVERDAWTEKNCRVCWQPDQADLRVLQRGQGCPHLLRAAAGKLPRIWTRRRNAVMSETYRCDDFIDKPPVRRRAQSTEESIPLFDTPEAKPATLIPVEGWPDYKALKHKAKGGDHA